MPRSVHHMALVMFGGLPLPLPGPHHVSAHAVVLQTARPGPKWGWPDSVPDQRTGLRETPPPLKATASFALVFRTSAPTLSHMAPHPPSSQISVRLPNWVQSSVTCSSASAVYSAWVTGAWPGSLGCMIQCVVDARAPPNER